MSASGIKDGFLTLLGAASVFGNDVSTNYDVLVSAPASAVVVGWMEIGDSPTTFGNWGQGERAWRFYADIFLKDTGNASALMDNTFLAIDKMVAALESDPTVQGTVDAITSFRASRPRDEGLKMGGLVFLPIFTEIDVIEFA